MVCVALVLNEIGLVRSVSGEILCDMFVLNGFGDVFCDGGGAVTGGTGASNIYVTVLLRLVVVLIGVLVVVI